MLRISAIFAAIIFVVPALAEDRVPVELKACQAEHDGRARLACFDAALVKLEARPSDFGGEDLKQPESRAGEPAILAAKATQVVFNAVQHFTLALDNGQVWRQLDSDTAVARFREGSAVRIKRGFLDSYSLSADGAYGSFKVKRIK